MWRKHSPDIDSITGLAGAALLFSLLSQYLSTPESEVGSEIVCWIILPILFGISQNKVLSRDVRRLFHDSVGSRTSLWVVAGGIAIACVYEAEIGRVGLFVRTSTLYQYLLANHTQPFLTTCLLVIEKYSRPELHASKTTHAPGSPIVKTISGSILVAAFATLALSSWDIQDYALSLIPVVALLVVYVAFRPTTFENFRSLPIVDPDAAILFIAGRVLFILLVVFIVQLYIFGNLSDGVPTICLLGLMKALSWFFTSKTIYNPVHTRRQFEGTSHIPKSRHASWTIATTTRVFSVVSTADVSMQPSGLKAVSQVLASCLLLGQLVYLLPKQAKARHLLWSLGLFAIIPYIANVLAIRDLIQFSPSVVDSNWEHPVSTLR